MISVEKMPMLFSGNEMRAIALTIKKFFKNSDDIRTGKVQNEKIDDEELESMLADDTTFYIDLAMLKDIASRISAIEELKSVNLLYLGLAEILNIHAANACVLSSISVQAMRGQESPSLEDTREHDLLRALAYRLEKIYDENKK